MGCSHEYNHPHEARMENETKKESSLIVDRGLVAMFLEMSPEERLKANDNMVRVILELRNAYQGQETNRRGPKRNT